jgi:hypothetical protein
MRIIGAALLAGAILIHVQPARAAADSVFDQPQDKKEQVFPETKDSNKTTLTCLYYPAFMVKQIDEGEIGAYELAIIPGDRGKPPCQRDKIAGEHAVDPKDWSGYFKGVKGAYVLFDADDGVNDALGFAVFDTNAEKLFEDSAKGDIEAAALDGGRLALRYVRSFAGDCSVLKGGDGCWNRIAAAAGIDAAAKPDCAAGYAAAKKALAQGRCEADSKPLAACMPAALKEIDRQKWNDAPSVVLYQAETVIAGGRGTTKALGPATVCHPSD